MQLQERFLSNSFEKNARLARLAPKTSLQFINPKMLTFVEGPKEYRHNSARIMPGLVLCAKSRCDDPLRLRTHFCPRWTSLVFNCDLTTMSFQCHFFLTLDSALWSSNILTSKNLWPSSASVTSGKLMSYSSYANSLCSQLPTKTSLTGNSNLRHGDSASNVDFAPVLLPFSGQSGHRRTCRHLSANCRTSKPSTTVKRSTWSYSKHLRSVLNCHTLECRVLRITKFESCFECTDLITM